ncbi:unnamed protein product [Spirodela intermedia]|uniref:Uncharacterized protein n=1 Tax=Spirodela intermedia TaxID=51605 RepID=A0A7I8K0S9_SPIIN|nr:unnamed protein product [Spirodela intermedia]
MKKLSDYPYSESSAERAADHTPIQLSTAGASGEIASLEQDDSGISHAPA